MMHNNQDTEPLQKKTVNIHNNTNYSSFTGGRGRGDIENFSEHSEPELNLSYVSHIDEEIVLNHKGTIGMLGSISIAVNSLTGPAMLNLCSIFQRAGLIPTVLTIAFICALSTFCSLHMANVISKVPGNRQFHLEIEYSEAFRIFWGQNAFVFTQIAFFGCITCLNVASIVDTAQVIDQILSRFKNGTVAFAFKGGAWSTIRWAAHSCTGERLEGDICQPFAQASNDDEWLLTGGYLLSCLIFLPMSLKDLKENASFQIVGFIVLIVLSFQFVFAFYLHGINFENCPLWGDDWSDLFGVVLFNFAVVIAVPAWLYERHPSVSVSTALERSSWLGFVLYLLVGGLGSLTMPNVADNMLQSMMSGVFGPFTEICSMIFAFFIIGLGIPLFSVLTRCNLTGSGLCTRFQANLLAVYLPWGVAWTLYSGGRTTALLGWGGIFFTSLIVFICPLLLALHTMYFTKERGSVSIYGGWFEKRSQQEVILFCLIIFSIISIVMAVYGEIM